MTHAAVINGIVPLQHADAAYPVGRTAAPAAAPCPVLAWREQLATGIPAMDAEHGRPIDLFNEPSGLHQRGAAVEELRAALVELRRYTVYHFRTEADLMQRHPVNAENRRAHLAAHSGFVRHIVSAEALVDVDPGHDMDETQLLRNADFAMYAAKNGGRDGVKIHLQEVAAPVN